MPWLEWLERQQDAEAAGKTPYRLLEPVPKLDYGEADSTNMLIEGDNLDALKALLPYYGGQVKCVFIDPPYNTKSAFDQYDDNLEHSKWLSTLYPRLLLLRDLLAEDGSIWVTIDDREGHYLKVLMDEIFGRKRFVATCVWQKRYSRENRESIGDVHDYIHVYAINPAKFKLTRNLVPMTEEQAKVYRNPNKDPLGRWRAVPMTAQAGHATPEQFYEVVTPGGAVHRPSEGRCWGVAKATYERLLSEGRIYFGKDNMGQPNIIRYLSEVPGLAPWTWWPSNEVGHNDEAKKEANELFGGDISFGTPKPERLIQRILHIATNPNDLVLDSFLGSGTTAAVAHKMRRRWIGIEMGEHALTHCHPRLAKVVDGHLGGISLSESWQGGGGFRYYKLGPTVFDENGHIRDGIKFEWLAAHVWFAETGSARSTRAKKVPLLGVHEGVAYYLLFNGVLGDKRPDSGNVLTLKVLAELPEHDGPKVIYGEASRLGHERLKALGITFRQTPYDIKAR